MPLNFLKVKIIENVKKILEVNGEKRLALKCSQEIRTETRISNFNLKGDLVRNFLKKCKENTKVRKNPITVENFPSDPNGETRISHFNLKGDLVCKIYVWGDMFRIIHVTGNMFRIIYLKGDMFCIILDIYIYLKWDVLGQLRFHFIHLINLIGQNDVYRIYLHRFHRVIFTHKMSNHG